MVKRNNRYKDIHNRCLDLITTLPEGSDLPTESRLSSQLTASRTTIRAVLSNLSDNKIIDWQGRQKQILRQPKPSDYFVAEETHSTDQIIENAFMQSILGGELDIGAHINESELARMYGVSTSAVREFLIRFSRFGLIDKEPNRGWTLKGFTKEFALELSDVRSLFELRSLQIFLKQPKNAQAWQDLEELENDHLNLKARVDKDYLEFSTLDSRFHRTINSVSDNRFIDDFYDLIAIIFHYHYRWNKKDERERNTAAIDQHLAIMDGLKHRDEKHAVRACKAHLAAARETLLRSIDWD